MNFFNLLNELTENNVIKKQKNGTLLIDLVDSPPPLAQHYIYAPIDSKAKHTIVEQFKQQFPVVLLELYEFCNGFDMFWDKKELSVRKKTIDIPFSRFICFGIPSSSNRDPEKLQPIDIRLEDLDRPDNIPNNYLKFGSYSLPRQNDMDLWICIESYEVFATPSNSSVIIASWKTLDDCLCSIFNTLNS